jgi:molybdate transport system substrate-binding protein
MLPAGCGGGESAAPDELVVLCGSSFVKPTEVLIQEFKEKTGIDVVTTVAGSEDFLPLVKAGRKGDVLVTHDPYLQYVTEAGALEDHADVGFLSPVLAVQEGNPQGLGGIEDLTRPGLKVALTDPKYSTCGEMVFALLEKKGLKEKVMANVESRLTKGHSTLGTFLETRTVDAVIMWNGVAHDFEDDLDTVKIPYEYDQEIGVHVIGLSYTKRPDLLKKFIDFAKERGPALFSEHGYVK